MFVVQWERVRLLDKKSAGVFTFQAALYKTGDVTFSYRDVRSFISHYSVYVSKIVYRVKLHPEQIAC